MDYALLLLGSAIFGAGYAANLLSRYAAADVSLASERGKAISLVVWGATVGAVIGPSLIGPAGDWVARMGLPAISGAFVIGIATFAMAALLLGGLLRPDPLAVSRLVAAADPALRHAAPARRLGDLLRLAEVQVALITLMCSNMVMIGIMSMTPVYMHDHGHPLPFVGIVISAHVVGMYIFSPVAGWLTDRVGRQAVIMLSALTLIAAAVLNALTPATHGALIALGMFLIGLGWNLGFVAGSALLTDAVLPVERPRLQGLADTWMGVAAAVGSLGSGPILAGYGFPALNVVVVLLVVFPLGAMGVRRGGAVTAESRAAPHRL
jgi:MFS family permease